MRDLHRIQKNKLLSAILAGCCLSTSLMAQSLQSSFLGSGSAHATLFSFGTLDWSIGEPLTATLSSPLSAVALTQGFHQVFISVTSVSDFVDIKEVSVFPNPAMEMLNITGAANIRWRLWNTTGDLLREETSYTADHQLSVADLQAGLYLLEVQFEQPNPPHFFKVIVFH